MVYIKDGIYDELFAANTTNINPKLENLRRGKFDEKSRIEGLKVSIYLLKVEVTRDGYKNDSAWCICNGEKTEIDRDFDTSGRKAKPFGSVAIKIRVNIFFSFFSFLLFNVCYFICWFHSIYCSFN